MNFEHLFSPIKINKTLIKNRVVAAPIGDYFEEKAMGGAGIVIAGHAIVEPGFSSFASADEPYIFSKYEYEDTRRRILQIHRGGAMASIELFHGGLDARVKDFAKGPNTFKRKDGTQVVAMDESMMQETLDWYYKTAQEAKDIGFDMIFMHFGHGWLPAQFLSPLFNHRTDEYGGSLENRMRFPKRILEVVRDAVGPDYPIDMRISASEYVPESIEFDDVKAFIQEVEPLIDTVQISAGMDMNREANVHTVTTNFESYMPNVKWAAEVKKAVTIPVSVVGAVPSPEAADQLIKDGIVDLVAFGRSFIADPYWPKKAMAGHTEDIAPCVRCMYCYHIATNHKNVGCTVNPRYNNESFIPRKIPKAEVKKRVVIIGGGPGGMKAAVTASKAGHEVILFEKETSLGGQLRFVEKEYYKDEIRRLMINLKAQIEKATIDLRLGVLATPELVKAEKPDAVIIAVGGEEFVPPVKGLNQPNVYTGTEAIINEDKLGNEIIVLGGGTIGSEIALELAVVHHKNVTIVEMGAELSPQGNSLFKIALRQKMDKAETLTTMLKSRCLEVNETAMIVSDEKGIEQKISYDNIIVCTGMRPKQQLAETFFGIASDTSMIGDCVQPRKIMEAIFEGHNVALSL
ncbi:FAD-dependent oxidoreductase [Enterococcus faecium]|uniref:oxidoreductase n=1 Tax=Enterococcus faecium TaxID=1352 RepID=UPI0011074D5C|nr:FAD-dependent oxidoreductase [Enterococcus faecium]